MGTVIHLNFIRQGLNNMAINENFVFTDPVAAEQAVRMADIERARAEAQGRALAATTQALSQGRGLGQDRALQLYQLNQQQREAELNRQARARELEQAIKSQEKIAGMQTQSYADRETQRQNELMTKQRYDALLNEIERDNPPTDSEFAARAVDLPEHLQSILRTRLSSRRAELNNQFDIVDNMSKNWQARLEAIPLDKKTGKRSQAAVDNLVNEFRKTKDAAYVNFESATQRFSPTIRRPRIDILPGTGGAGPVPAVTPIEDVRNRLAAEAATGIPGLLENNVNRSMFGRVLGDIVGGGIRAMVPNNRPLTARDMGFLSTEAPPRFQPMPARDIGFLSTEAPPRFQPLVPPTFYEGQIRNPGINVPSEQIYPGLVPPSQPYRPPTFYDLISPSPY